MVDQSKEINQPSTSNHVVQGQISEGQIKKSLNLDAPKIILQNTGNSSDFQSVKEGNDSM